ncbi:hypothetical protein [Arthrobacter sp. ISL-30]|uniref:hypothetical protein n=1 Tax=Arthrobacter sp. ISL-30 TaxID=2819109 RepID=UPI002036160B|nr:hypothetical protein [Arthrobacter sp. ISL-30]
MVQNLPETAAVSGEVASPDGGVGGFLDGLAEGVCHPAERAADVVEKGCVLDEARVDGVHDHARTLKAFGELLG